MIKMSRKLKPTYKMPFRRRREGKTDYRNRLALLKSGKYRLVVRKSLKYITVQIIEYDEVGDRTVVSVSSKQLRTFGWQFSCDNIPAAYLTGILIAKKASDKFGQLLAFGITISIIMYTFVNVAVTTGLLPTTGLPLPFISYGGTSLLFLCVGIGILRLD